MKKQLSNADVARMMADSLRAEEARARLERERPGLLKALPVKDD